MSIKDLTITDQNVQSTYVQSQPDRLTGTAQQNKAVFDALPQLIRQRFNELLELLTAESGAGEIPVGPIEGVTAETVQQALEAIQQNLTAYINKIKAATGAAEVGVSKINGMQAENVQKALEELRKAIDDSVSGIIPGGSITADMIQDGAIVQLGALLAVAAAAAYDPEGSYAVGNYCTNGGKLHKCGTPIDSGEEWNAEHWTETTVANELEERVRFYHSFAELGGLTEATATPELIAKAMDINSIAILTLGTAASSAGWIPLNYPLLIVKKGGGSSHVMFEAQAQAAGYGTLYRGYYNANASTGDKWTGWKKIVTDMTPQERPLTLKSGFAANGVCTFFKTQENVVFLAGGVSGTIPANQDTQIGTLQAGFYPEATCRRDAVTNAGTGYIEIRSDGTVWIHSFAAGSQCWFSAQFRAKTEGGE